MTVANRWGPIVGSVDVYQVLRNEMIKMMLVV